jgi:hypothetical protein
MNANRHEFMVETLVDFPDDAISAPEPIGETPDFGGMTLRVGDLNGDGAPDLLLTQSEYGSREIRCLTAMNITGARLWQTGIPSPANGRVYSDLPVQVYDWDSRDEVIVVGWKGVRIYANARPLALPTLYNSTIYRGM